MNFIELRKQFYDSGLIDIKDVQMLCGAIDRRRLYEWQRKGYIERVTNNYYIFTDIRIDDMMLRVIANRIYKPSYIGLETALSYYGFIPEAVFQVTSLTTKKTRNINTAISNFKYRSIHKSLYWGYKLEGKDKQPFFISDPEKTVLDYLYFNSHLNSREDIEELRLNVDQVRGVLSSSKLKRYLALFANKRLKASVKILTEVCRVEF